MPDLRSGAVSGAAWLAGLPWRMRPGRGKRLSPSDPVNLMLVVLMTSVVIGLIESVYGRWQNMAIATIAVVMTSLYFFLQRTL